MLTFSSLKNQNEKNEGSVNNSTNNGGFLGGLGHFFTSLAAGIGNIGEGAIDAAIAPLADLTGNHELAKNLFKNNHVGDWYKKQAERVNPTGFNQFAGDVAHGIGQSAWLFVPYAGAPIFFSGIMAQGISGAADQTGEVGVKEAAYGLTSGAVEGALEYALGAAGKGVKSIATAAGKKMGSSAIKSTASAAARKGLASKLLSSAASEFAEEATSEVIDTVLLRAYQIDPNKELSLRDVLYAGAVGAVSGAVTTGVVEGGQTIINQTRGAEIIKNGNDANLVDTATYVADRLAANGTNFEESTEWLKRLRGELDAYNKLPEPAKKGARGQTLLGEMQASLYFIESKANVEAVKLLIQNSDEQTKATWAEYINSAIPEEKRRKVYTAADITSNTDGIAKELAVLAYAGATFDSSTIDEYEAREAKIASVIAEESQLPGAVPMQNPTESTPVNAQTPSGYGQMNAGGQNVQMPGAAVQTTPASQIVPPVTSQGVNQNINAPTVPQVGTMPVANVNGAVDTTVVAPITKENESTNENAQNLRSEAVGDADRANALNKGAEKAQGKRDTHDGDNKVKNTEQGASETETEEKVDIERAKREAARVVEWEKKNAPTADELNRARGLVKGFDNLDNRRRSAIIRMMRSSEGVNADIVKGVANIMAVNPSSNLEFRFSDLTDAVNKGGLVTKVGNKTVVIINSNVSKTNTIKGTVAHELVHYLEGREDYDKFAEYVRKHAKADKVAEIEEKYKKHYMHQYKAEEQKKAPDATVDEIAARVAERMSTDEFKKLIDSEVTATLVGNALNSDKLLRQYAKRDEKLIKRVLNLLKSMFTRLKKGEEDKATSDVVEGMINRFNALLQMPESETEQTWEKKYKKYSFSSIAYTFFGQEDMSVADFEAGNYKSTEGYNNYVEECLNNMRQTREGFNEGKARSEIEKSIDGIVRVAIASKNAGYDIYDSEAQRSTRDSKKRLLFSSLEPNSDYFTSSDISSICDKRKNFAEIYDDIVREEERRGVPKEKRFFSNVNNYFVIHDIMARKGLTQPCKQCYVESMRKNLTPMANAFIKLVTETDEKNKSNNQLYDKSGKLKEGNAKIRRRIRELLNEEGLSDKMFDLEMLTTADGLAQLRLQHPLIYETFNSFYGQSKPKMPKAATPFRFGELTALLTDNNGKINQSLVKRINATGGFRLQSYSDFQIKNYVDVLQVIFEAGTLGLSGHAYTKVPAFLDATDKTNLKRNISIFMYRDGDEWKIDRNDSFPYKLEDIYKLVDADKSGNTGIIAVSQNEDMSAWIMANDHVGYGIPFHKSGMKMATVRDTDVVTEDGRTVKGYSGIKDHTKSQSETYAKGENKGKKVKAPINIYSFWDFDSTRMSKKNLIEKNVKRYIDECEKAGYNPKFKEYLSNNERVLNATLDYAKRLGFAGADATVADISFKYKGYTIPYGYYKFLGDFGMFTPDGKASPHKTLSLADYDFDKAVKFFKDSEKIRRNEMLQQIANGTEREKYRKLLESGEMTLTDLGRVIKEKRDEVVAEVVERKYSLNVRFTNGGSEIVNPYTIDKKDIMRYLKMSLRRELHDSTYFPVASHTPYALISTLRNANIYVADKPMAMQAKKAKQSQIKGDPYKKNGLIIRHHEMLPEEIVEVIEKLEKPEIIIQETNQTKKKQEKGKIITIPASDKFAVFVTLDSGKQCVAVIEFDSEMTDEDIVYDTYGEEYHTTVTVFEPDVVRNGIPFDYAEYLLLNPNNIELDIKIESPQSDAAYGEKFATTSNRDLSGISIHQNEPVVNTFEEKKSEERRYDLADSELDADGAVRDEYFEAAVKRAMEGQQKQANIIREERAARNNEAVEKRKKKFDKVLADLVKVQKQIEKLKKSADEGVKSKIKTLQKKYNELLGDLGAIQIELRQMGYDMSAEQRLIERQQKQIEAQKEQILDLKTQQREIEIAKREDAILVDLEKRERTRQSKMFAKQRAEIGKVYSVENIKRDLKNMVDQGLISKFFGGEYKPNLKNEEINAIAQYITLQLNLAGDAEKAEAEGLLTVAANDALRKIRFTNEEGEKVTLHEIVDEDTQKQFADMLRTDIQEILRNSGELNPFAELQRAYNNVSLKYLDKMSKTKEGEAFATQFPKTLAQAKKIKILANQKKGIASDGVQKVLNLLGGLTDESGRLRSGKVDEAIKAAAQFFENELGESDLQRTQLTGEEKDDSKNNAKLANDSLLRNQYEVLLSEMNDFIQLRQGREGEIMDSKELKMLSDILSGTRTALERYNKEKIAGRWVDIETAVGEWMADATKERGAKTFASKFLETKAGKWLRNAYFYEILAPETVIESLESFKLNGLLKTLYHDVRVATQRSEDLSARLKDPFAKFIDSKDNQWTDEKGHKHSYRNKLNEKQISVDGVNITLGEAINLYMLTKREHARLGLEEGGYVTYDDQGVKKVKLKIADVDITRSNLAAQFDETDRAFIKLAEEFFNEKSTKLKRDADMEIYGFSNVEDGYYVPIVRDRYSRMNGVTDIRQNAASFATVNNKSFNKNLIRNAKALEGQNILRIINDHIDGLSDYVNLYLPLKAFDRVYNRGVVDDNGDTKTVREMLNEEWSGSGKYFKKLFNDIQGISDHDPSNIDKAVSWIRSNWVSSVLGANIKVVFTQTTSLGAATQVIDAKYVTKAAWIITPGTGFAEGVQAIADRADKYSDIIFARHFEMGALKAQGNLDKIGGVAKATGGLIEVMDRKVCLSLFHAAELSVEASTGYKVGTEENATRAAKLADEAIYTTQAMSSSAEKSNLQRSRSEIAKLFSMFTSDSVKNLSHFIGNIAKYNAHKNRALNGEAEYKDVLKKDAKAIRRSARTMVITGVMLGLISQAFKYLYNKEEEEPEMKIHDLGVDVISSTLNVFPIVSEFVDKLFFDYDMSINVLDIVNDTLDTFGNSFETFGKAIGGQYVSEHDIHKSTVNLGKSVLTFFGMPISPAERTITGLLRRFAPSAIYGYDAATYNTSYTADLKAAVEDGDEALAEHILETLYKNEATGVYSTEELEEIARLYGLTDSEGKHYNVLPQKIGDTINDVKLTAKQRRQFEGIYSQASEEVNKLIRSQYYDDLTDEQKAKAIKNIYSLYYNRASAEVVGADWSNAQAYSRLTSNLPALYSAQAYKSGLEPYKNLRGKEVTVKEQFTKYVKNLKLSKTDELVVLYANGYRDKSTKAQIIAYINSLSIPDSEKQKIAERLGFDFANGTVSEKKDELEVRNE